MQTAKLVDFIMTETAPTVNIAAGVLLVQMLFTGFLEIRFFYNSIKHSSMAIKVIICIVPSLFIMTWCIFSSLLLGSVVSEGLNDNELLRILQHILTDEFFAEFLVAASALLLISIIYKFLYKIRIFEWFLCFGLELGVALCFGALFAGVMLHIADVSKLVLGNTVIVAYLTSGYIMLIYKLTVTVVALLFSLIFHERSVVKPTHEEIIVCDGYEEAVLRYINRNAKILSVTYMLSVVGLFAIITFVALNDEKLSVSLKNIFSIYVQIPFMIPIFAILFIMCIYFLCIAFFPRFSKAYRTLARHSINDEIFYKFYHEVVLPNKTVPERGSLNTESFFLTKPSFGLIIEVKANTAQMKNSRNI